MSKTGPGTMSSKVAAFFFCLGTMVFLCCALARPVRAACAFDPVPEVKENAWTLTRGINMAEFWQHPPGQKLLPEDVNNVKNLGFTFVRLPVSEQWLSPEGTRLQELRCDITAFLNDGLAVIVDFHPSHEEQEILAAQNSDALLARLEDRWAVLESVLNGLPADKIYLGLLNEPPRSIKDWWKAQGRLVERLRARFPDTAFIATDNFGLYGTLRNKKPYPDENIFYDFHFYTPMFFTHHNARWTTPPPDLREKIDNLRYPANLNPDANPSYEKMKTYLDQGWDKEKLAALLEKYPLYWRDKVGAKILCLEFGVYRPFVDNDSRLRWLKDMRELFEENNIPWALWNYKGGYGLFPGGDRPLDAEMAEALGLNLQTSP
ncbi:MAG TPA: cellulase family glycosylhydrolase [Alphaproteobacteria bacterium]|nr:cellulase family glycosylhydrolase [Alphaproteobacteria bacterium]